ncbi:MAG: deoxyribose-phosphate aldolase [Elusimicrobiota bacterium]|jgi:deoxyribose-phosphate aldolase|nr:deoxyribose-phosphate aldolase [Elusimicrobiota bacterium]
MKIAKYIDHTLLKAYASDKEIEILCREAMQYGFASVCVNPFWVSSAAKILRGSNVKVCTVIGFPLGYNKRHVKAYETAVALQDGAREFDMVMNIGALKSRLFDEVQIDIETVRRAARENILKVIIETFYLTEEEKVKACQIAAAAGADFVKTSTGFSGKGATEEDVRLMKQASGVKVKAAGGIQTKEDMFKMIDAGADRIGTSCGAQIISSLETHIGAGV